MIYFLKPSREQVASIRTNLIMRSTAPFIKVLTYGHMGTYLRKAKYGDLELKKDKKAENTRKAMRIFLTLKFSLWINVDGQTPNSRSTSFFVSRATFVIVCPLL